MMRHFIIVMIFVSGMLIPVQFAMANISLNSDEVSSIQVKRTSGGSRIFNENNGVEEFVIRKVIKWINSANIVMGPKDLDTKKTPISVLKIKMKNGDVILLEPAYNCAEQKHTKVCTLADGDVTFNRDDQKVRLRSVQLFDWLLTGWKQEPTAPPEDTKELMVNDILMLLVSPEIDKAVIDYYSDYLTETPLVYPYQVEIVDVRRVGGFRTFDFLLILETTPVVGPHISVGKDRLTFEISPTITPGQIKLLKFEHLETHELPPNWQDIIKKKNQ